MATTGIARAGGYADYSSTGTGGQFIPELWSALLAEKLYPNTVFDSITNRAWEGEINRLGAIVHIRTQPTLPSSPYQIGQTINYVVPTSTPTQLVIDRARYWAFQIDTIDMFESDLDLLDVFAQNAAQQLMADQDVDLLSTVYTQFAAANQGANAGVKSNSRNLGATGAPLVINPTNVVSSLFLAAKQILDEQNVPFDGRRYIVLPSNVAAVALASDLKFAYETGDAVSPLRTGYLGTIANFKVYQSNNVPTVVDGSVNTQNVIFGWQPAIAWASQFIDNQIVKLINQAGWGMRSIVAYGFNTVNPNFAGFAHVAVGSYT
ncbi:MAG: hypothetical protein IRZ03_13645 [Acidobacterium ailaaui]|nr:hypothetical protein [Pseudacidobacterium ailaaui]